MENNKETTSETKVKSEIKKTISAEKGQLITPSMADQIMAAFGDSKRRKLKPSKLRQMVEDLKADNWKHNGSTIRFDTNGILIDGYHRLTACVISGIPFYTLIVTDVPVDAKMTIDTGTSRTPADVLNFNGINVNNKHVSTINPFLFGAKIGTKDAYQISPSMQAEVYEKFKPQIDFAVDVAGNLPAPVRAVIARAEPHIEDKSILTRFAQILRTGTSDEGLAPEDNSAVLLRNVISKKKPGAHPAKKGRKMYFQTEIALDKFIKREKVERLRVSDDEDERFPLPSESVGVVEQALSV